MLAQYLVLCIFTWCRVYMALLHQINLATPAIYSISILLAGLTCGPFVMGPLPVNLLLVFLYLAAALWAWCGRMDPYGTDWEELTRERVRSELLDGAAMSAWRGLSPNASKEESDVAAERAFRRLDTDGSGVIELGEAMRLPSAACACTPPCGAPCSASWSAPAASTIRSSCAPSGT